LVLLISLQRRVRLADAAIPEPGERQSDREQDGGKDQQQLCRSRQPLETVGYPHDEALFARLGLAELAQQIEEILGNRFAKRVIIDASKRAPKIAGTLLASGPV
jgi:hypothetical protein